MTSFTQTFTFVVMIPFMLSNLQTPLNVMVYDKMIQVDHSLKKVSLFSQKFTLSSSF